MGHNIEQGVGGIDVLLKFKGFVASVPRLLKLIVGLLYLWLATAAAEPGVGQWENVVPHFFLKFHSKNEKSIS
jgi:hypothetical protein